MSTQAQIAANRLNAQRSTGPLTPRGKAVASQNSLKHGLSARHNVIACESQADYELYRDQILDELNPLTPLESMLADRVVCLSWRLKRAVRIQNQAIDALLQRNTSDPLAKLAQSFPLIFPDNAQSSADDHLALGRAFIKDLSNSRVTERLLMYERRIEHSLFKTMQELQRLNLIRNLQPQQDQPTTNDKPRTMNNELQTIMQNEPNFKMGKMTVSTVAPRRYPDEQPTIASEHCSERTQTNPISRGERLSPADSITGQASPFL